MDAGFERGFFSLNLCVYNDVDLMKTTMIH